MYEITPSLYNVQCRLADNPAGPSYWSYNPASRPHDAMDIAHIVQVQLQMHATGAKVGYLCSWSLSHGSTVFRLEYSEAFMRGVSKVLQQVIHKYLQPGCTALPKCDMTEEDSSLQNPWYRMMGALADCVSSVKNLGSVGAHTSHTATLSP